MNIRTNICSIYIYVYVLYVYMYAGAVALNHYFTLFRHIFLLSWMLKILTYEKLQWFVTGFLMIVKLYRHT
jgi:hypothetical protein